MGNLYDFLRLFSWLKANKLNKETTNLILSGNFELALLSAKKALSFTYSKFGDNSCATVASLEK